MTMAVSRATALLVPFGRGEQATKSFIYPTFHKTILPPPLSTLHPLTIRFYYYHGCGLRTHSLPQPRRHFSHHGCFP